LLESTAIAAILLTFPEKGFENKKTQETWQEFIGKKRKLAQLEKNVNI